MSKQDNTIVANVDRFENTGDILHSPSDVEKKVLNDIFFLFRRTAESRNRRFEFFDGLNLIEYIEDSVRRFTTNVDEREYIEDWQASVHDQITHTKVLTFLGKLISILPIANVKNRGTEDIRKANILENLYQYTEDLDDYEELMIHVLLETIVKGTGIGYEDVQFKEKIHRDVKNVNDEITEKETKEKSTKFFGALVPLEDFYPGSVSIRRIEEQPFCFWRTIYSYSDFMNNWSMFDRSKHVSPRRTYSEKEERPYYLDYISDGDVEEGQVELLRFYDQEKDQYILLANGVWLNPIEGKNGEEIISPLPWNHKQLPFWHTKFDIYGDWFYGKSLPDRLKTMQDILNVLTNMLLDQSFLTIFPPLLTAGSDAVEDDYLRPGRRTPVDTQGLPLSQQFLKLDMGTPGGWHQFILDYTRRIMEESSIDKVSSGIAGAGDRTTAAEIRTAAEGVAAILQIFAKFVNRGVKRKAFLRCGNILQFAFDPKTPMVRRVLGDDGEAEVSAAFNVFTIDEAVLSSGKRGVKVIEVYKDKKQMPNKATQVARAQVNKKDIGADFEFDALPASYMRNYLFDIKLVPNPKSEANKEIEKAEVLESTRVYMSFFPEIVNKQELAARMAEKFGDDPTKIFQDEVLMPQDKPAQGELDNGVSTTPTTNNANNTVRSAGQSEPGTRELAQLSANITG